MLHSTLIKAGAYAATAITGNVLSILVFHRVLERQDPLFPGEMHASRFDELLCCLSRSWHIVPLGKSITMLASGTLSSRSLAITFDDGYADNYSVACPILKKYLCPATIFISTGYLDGGCMWNDRIIESIRQSPKKKLDLPWLSERTLSIESLKEKRNAIDRIISAVKYLPFEQREQICCQVTDICDFGSHVDLMLTKQQLKGMRGGLVDFGAHTVLHPILASLSDVDAEREISKGKEELESLIEEPVSLFAYPNGKPQTDYLPKHVNMVKKAGFHAAVSTDWGACSRMSDAFQLPRFSPWDQDARKFNARLVKNLFARSVENQVPVCDK